MKSSYPWAIGNIVCLSLYVILSLAFPTLIKLYKNIGVVDFPTITKVFIDIMNFIHMDFWVAAIVISVTALFVAGILSICVTERARIIANLVVSTVLWSGLISMMISAALPVLSVVDALSK